MAQASVESVVLETTAAESSASVSPAVPIQIQKVKGRKRILQSLQRMSSSSSLAKLSRTPSSSYRTGGRGSVSCISLSSGSASYGSYGNSLASELSVGYSTAPTSAVTTPGILPFPSFDDKTARSRHLGSVPIPDFRTTTRIAEEEDYFSIPVQKSIEKPKSSFNFWKDLPSELAMDILSYLEPREIVRSSAVSKQWHSRCFDGQLWSILDTSDFYRDIPAKALINIVTSAGPFVRDLNLRGCVQLREQWHAKGLSGACSNLENFSLEGCRIEKTAIHCFLLQNPRLVYINLSGLAGATNSAMKLIAENCPKLEHLNVSWCNNVDTRGLRKVVEACPGLRDLRAGEVAGWDDVEFMRMLFERNSLERLILMNCDSLNDESLAVLMEGQDSEMDYITGRRIAPARKLKHLDLTRCRGISHRGLEKCIDRLPEMEGLQLNKCHGITDDVLASMLNGMPKLTHLDLEELVELSNTVLQSLATAPCAKILRHMSVSYCENLGDVGMLPILKNCTNLESLDMDNTRVSDLSLAEAAAMVRARATRTTQPKQQPSVGLRLAAYDCQNVTWTGIREVLSRNAEVIRKPIKPASLSDSDASSETPSAPPQAIRTYPTEIIQLKCFYNYQPTVEEHTKRVLRADFSAANRLERKWAVFMIAQEEAGASGAGARRRRRRAREAQMMHADEEDAGAVNGGGNAGVGGGRRRRARSGGCVVM
ncbi:RNI-like protein [Aureobasidium sp. EXF-3400]|nr:RNI-like protein [Aureobasidium sp. EXF-12344]KAI4768295.1 RNI-like protein [Aureobasidium sp. EXF-3400]